MDSTLFDRISELCHEQGITIKKLSEKLGFSESLIRKWKNTSSPSIDKVRLVAKELKVSTDYLIGASSVREPAETLMADEDFISLQRARSKMGEKDKKRMMNIMRSTFDEIFAEQDKNDNESK